MKIKKYRIQHGLFVVEGEKGVRDFLASSYQLKQLYTTSAKHYTVDTNKVCVSCAEMSQISQLSTASNVLALFSIPPPPLIKSSGLMVALDNVNDPGNLGAIIRLCDWFGVDQLICSNNTVDCYNPKTVMASMGSLSRLSLVYTDLEKVISSTKLPVFATCLQGNNIYQTSFSKDGLLIFGNEANGISDKILKITSQKISIPKSNKDYGPESINVANAVAIVLSEFSRNGLG